MIEAADVLRAAHEALVDNHIDHREEITIRDAIREAERALLRPRSPGCPALEREARGRRDTRLAISR